MMSYETAYRVFENKTVIEIIDEVTDGFPNLNSTKADCGSASFPKIAYCVQYNKSTFNFLSQSDGAVRHLVFLRPQPEPERRFEHDDAGHRAEQLRSVPEHGGAAARRTPGASADRIINKDLQASALIIKDFQRVYAPMTRRGRFSNFNLLKPTDPITNVSNIQVGRDLIQAGTQRPQDRNRPPIGNPTTTTGFAPNGSPPRSISTAHRGPARAARRRMPSYACQPMDASIARQWSLASAVDAQCRVDAWVLLSTA